MKRPGLRRLTDCIPQLTVSLFFLISFSIRCFAGNSNEVNGPSDKQLRGNGLMFTANKGQLADTKGNLRPDVLFSTAGGGAGIYLRKTGISYVYSNRSEVVEQIKQEVEVQELSGKLSEAGEKLKKRELLEKASVKVHRIDMDFLNSLPELQAGRTLFSATGEDEVEGYSNFYYPHCPQGVTNVKSYNKVQYKNIYAKIDVTFYGSKGNGMEYDIIVQPHGDPTQIKLNWTGADKIEIDNKGDLLITTSVNEFYESIPRVYQIIEGKTVLVKASYELTRSANRYSPIANFVVSFKLGHYNPDFPLVIDPWVTYYGDSDTGTDIATDNTGNVVSTGYVVSPSFPVLPGGYTQAWGLGGTNAYAQNAYVLKFSQAGTRLWATYYGGSDFDTGNGIAADNSGDVVITGCTQSSDFPVTSGAFQTVYGGMSDAFVVKFNSDGVRLWATYYGGSTYENRPYNGSIATDNAGNILISGDTESSDFPVVAGSGYTQPFGGFHNAFVVKFNPLGSVLWATYYGGPGDDSGAGIATDHSGNIFITGEAGFDFPVLSIGGYSQAWLGGSAFVVKFNAAGVRQWATIYGGGAISGSTFGTGIATDNTGNVVLTGITTSADFPISPGAFQSVWGGSGDAFVVKFNTNGYRQWATFLGGNESECGWGLAIDAGSNIFIYGDFEDSGAGNYPISVCAFQNTIGGPPAPGTNENQFVAKYDSSGNQHCITYMGGPGEDDHDQNLGIALYGHFLYITGEAPAGYPVTSGAFQTSYEDTYPDGGSGNTFISQLCVNLCEAKVLGLGFSANSTSVCPSVPVKFSPTVANSCDTTGYRFQWTFAGGTPASSDSVSPTILFSGVGNHDVKLVVTTVCKTDSLILPSYITIHSCGLISALAVGSDACKGSCATLTCSGSSGTFPYTYLWSTGSTSQTISPCPLLSSTYTVTITDATGLTATSTAALTIHAPVVLVTTADTITCNGAADGSALVIVTSGTPMYTYLWSTSATGQTASNLAQGTYSVTVTDANNCQSERTVVVTQPTAIRANPGPVGLATCGPPNGVVSVDPSGGSGAYTFNWAPLGGTGQTAQRLIAGDYTVTITDANGCSLITSTTVGADTSLPIVKVSRDTSILSGHYLQLNAAGGLTYSWTPSNGLSDQNSNDPIADPRQTTTYTVLVTDANGCSSTDSVLVMVNEPTDCDSLSIFVPSAFSPNGDGQNDVFYVRGTPCVIQLSLTIFDRWGELVFETGNPSAGWNGTFRGTPMNTAVFVYFLNATLSNGERISKKGNLTLIR